MPTLPVVKSVIQSRAILQLVRQDFGIEDSLSCTLIKSMNNDVYQIAAPSGSRILKIYGRGYRKPSEAFWESDLIHHLAAGKVRVAQIFLTRTGAPFLTLNAPEGARLATLYEDIPGHWLAAADGLPVLQAMGNYVGEMYNSSDDFESPHRGRTLDLPRLMRQSKAVTARIFAGESAEKQSMLDLLDEADKRLTALTAAGIDWGVCHGDLALHNARVGPADTISLVDFENAGYGWRAADLSAIRHDMRNIDGGWEAFSEGFRERRPLSQSELTAIDWMVIPFWVDSFRESLRTPNFNLRRDERAARVVTGVLNWADQQLFSG